MSTSAFDKVEQAFHEALSARERAETVDLRALCRGDARVLAEVQVLLRHFEQANRDGSRAAAPDDAGFLNPAELHGSRTLPIVGLGGSMLEEWGASAFGQRVGEFTLIEQI